MGAHVTNAKDRSNRMKHLFANVDRSELEKHLPSPAADKSRASSAGMSGAVKSMQQSFSTVEAENERLRAQLQSAEAVGELDPYAIVPSFGRDRFDIEGDPEFPLFVESIRSNGQKLPILVRPVADKAGVHQVAFGHRRWRACQILRRPVRAVVAELTDEQLLVAQGIENAERANQSFIEQAAVAIDRITLVEQASKAETAAEGERLRAALLSSISHDLRTPLASIVGSVTSLRTLGDRMPQSDRDELLATIEEESGRLSRFVSNLLDMTRLEAGAIDIRRDWVEVRDVVASAVAQIFTIPKKDALRGVNRCLGRIGLLRGKDIKTRYRKLDIHCVGTKAGTNITVSREKD